MKNAESGEKPLGIVTPLRCHALLRITEVKKALGHRSDASIYKQIREGLFTNGVLIGQRARGWPDYEVEAIVNARIAGKSDTQIRELVGKLQAQRLTRMEGMAFL